MLERASFRFATLLLGAALWAGMPGTARADEDVKAAARKLAVAGIGLHKAGKHDQAVEKLQAAERLFHAPTHLLWIARAQAKAGKKIEAHRTYVSIEAEKVPNYAAEAFLKAQQTATAERKALDAELALLSLKVSGAEAPKLTVDGEALATERVAFPVAVAAGRHVVEGTAPGKKPARAEVDAKTGETTPVELRFEAPLAAAPAPGPGAPAPAAPEDEGGVPLAGIVTLAVGGAALIGGAVTGGLTLGQASDIKAQCPNDRCPASVQDDYDSATLLGNLSTGLFIGGGVIAATGVVLMFALPSGGDGDEGAATLRLKVTPGGAGLTGTF